MLNSILILVETNHLFLFDKKKKITETKFLPLKNDKPTTCCKHVPASYITCDVCCVKGSIYCISAILRVLEKDGNVTMLTFALVLLPLFYSCVL